MKRIITFFVICILSIHLFCLPAMAYTEVDYSCYEGTWEWRSENPGGDTVSLGSAELKIDTCTKTFVNFTFGATAYHFYDEISGTAPIVDNIATLTASGNYNNRVWTVTLKFYDTGIWFETDVKENGCGMMANPAFQFTTHTIEENEITVTVNGMPLVFDQQPIMKDDRVMVPIRRVFEALGADVYWDAQNIQGINCWQITSIKKDMKVVIANGAVANPGEVTIKKGTIDQKAYTEDMQILPLYAEPFQLNGRTLISARAVAEAMNAEVEWDALTQTVIITGDVSGELKSKEELQKIESFNREQLDQMLAAMEGVEYFGGLPEYDSRGKYFEVVVSDSAGFYDARVYADGAIIRE